MWSLRPEHGLRPTLARLRMVWVGLPANADAQLYSEQLIRRRLAQIAIVFALLVAGWIAVDRIALSGRELLSLAALRIGLAACLLSLARLAPRLSPLLGLLALMLLQTAFFAAMRGMVPPAAPTWLHLGYALFPFVLAAQLAIFPLPVARSLLLACPLIVLAAMPVWYSGTTPLHSLIGDFWLLALILTLSIWASAAQMTLLVDLWSARWDASHDLLTGLANRRSAFAQLNSEIARSRRNGSPLSLLLLDIDHFKRINDCHGHAVGDAVIQEFGHALRDDARGADFPARIGGEEFIVLLPDTAATAAIQAAERYRLRVASRAVAASDGDPVCFSCSIGAATLRADDRADLLMSRADAAMYAAKQAGRNRVCAEPEPERLKPG